MLQATREEGIIGSMSKLAQSYLPLERAHSLTGPWTTSAPQTAPASALIEFHDLFPPPDRAFYRALQQ